MRKAQRDAEKAVLTKLRRQLKSFMEVTPARGMVDAKHVGLQVAIREIDKMLRGDESKSKRNRQGQ